MKVHQKVAIIAISLFLFSSISFAQTPTLQSKYFKDDITANSIAAGTITKNINEFRIYFTSSGIVKGDTTT